MRICNDILEQMLNFENLQTSHLWHGMAYKSCIINDVPASRKCQAKYQYRAKTKTTAVSKSVSVCCPRTCTVNKWDMMTHCGLHSLCGELYYWFLAKTSNRRLAASRLKLPKCKKLNKSQLSITILSINSFTQLWSVNLIQKANH